MTTFTTTQDVWFTTSAEQTVRALAVHTQLLRDGWQSQIEVTDGGVRITTNAVEAAITVVMNRIDGGR